MKRILLPLSLLLLLALAAGCSAQGEAQLDPTMAQQLQIDETMAATLAPGIQDVDVTDRGTDLTLHVRQTLGNDRELYVLYDVTLAGTVILPDGEEGWFGPQTVTLQGVEESTASRGSVQSVFLDKEGQTITRQNGSVEWTAIKRTHDGRYQAVADEDENGFDASKAATFLQSVYEPTFTPDEGP